MADASKIYIIDVINWLDAFLKIYFHYKEHGALPHHIALTLTARRIFLGHSISSILI